MGGAMAADVRDVNEVLKLVGDKGRETYEKFLAAEHARAFAISGKGAYGWSSKHPDRAKAAAVALYHCNKLAKNVCRLYAMNDDVVFGRYARFEQETARIRTALFRETLVFAEYGDEEKDYRVAPTEALKTGEHHADTPLAIPGVRTIKTPELAKALGSAARPILIDVLEGDSHDTLPGAYWIKGAGEGLPREEANAEVRDRLGYILEGITEGNKATPLVFFCLDSRCWLSYNAALRARSLGYTNVMWYRGGVKAWKFASLQTLEAVQFGQAR
jgi:PQQ-dependent catabolism-associated CXXCW motif protein